MRELVLASSSPYRALLLRRLGLPFESCAPDVDETPRPDEPPDALVSRLSTAKALALVDSHPNALIIGSDQAAVCGDLVLGKPGTPERACEQLRALSGRTVTFLTGLCLLDARRREGPVEVVPTQVRFRTLTTTEIEAYVARERPLDCAGAFKSEGLGIALFEGIGSDDPTALIGLPLIALGRLLRQAGVRVL